VDPVTGLLLLLSDQSQHIAIVGIVQGELGRAGSYELPLADDEKPGGLDFTSPSRLLNPTSATRRSTCDSCS